MLCARNVVAQLEQASGSRLDDVGLLRVEGHVRCTSDFEDLPHVVDAASEHFLEVLGSRGLHARTLQGHEATPLGVPVMLGVWAHVDTSGVARDPEA